jgi:hypothetical protein
MVMVMVMDMVVVMDLVIIMIIGMVMIIVSAPPGSRWNHRPRHSIYECHAATRLGLIILACTHAAHGAAYAVYCFAVTPPFYINLHLTHVL